MEALGGKQALHAVAYAAVSGLIDFAVPGLHDPGGVQDTGKRYGGRKIDMQRGQLGRILPAFCLAGHHDGRIAARRRARREDVPGIDMILVRMFDEKACGVAAVRELVREHGMFPQHAVLHGSDLPAMTVDKVGPDRIEETGDDLRFFALPEPSAPVQQQEQRPRQTGGPGGAVQVQEQTVPSARLVDDVFRASDGIKEFSADHVTSFPVGRACGKAPALPQGAD